MGHPRRQAPWSPAQASVLYVFIAVLVSLASLLLGSATYLAYRTEAQDRRQDLERELKATADQLATSLALPVWYFDQQQITRILDHLLENKVVQEVAIEHPTGRWETITRARGRDGGVQTTGAAPSSLESAPTPGTVSVERNITHAGRTLGRLHLVYTTRFLEAELRSILVQGIGTVVWLDLLLIASLSLLMWIVVIRPLREIQHLAEAVSSGTSPLPAPTPRKFFGELASLRRFLSKTFELLEERFAALKLSEERFRVLVESTTDLIWSVDSSGYLLSFNTAFATHLNRYLGRSPCIGDSAEALLPLDYLNVWSSISAGISSQGYFQEEFTYQDGSVFEFSFNPIKRDGEVVAISVFGKDISARRASERALADSEARARSMLQTAMDGVWLLDEKGRFLEVNEAACRRLGYTQEELCRLTIRDIDATESEEETTRHHLKVIQQGADLFEAVHRRKDGSCFPVEISVTHLPEQRRMVAFVRDITERKTNERERNQLQFQLLQSQKMESLGRLAGGVAHDMNNVLGAILGLASAHMESQPAGSPLHQAFVTICKATERGGKMVKGLLGFARQSPAENNRLDMNTLLREQVALLERTTLAKVRLQMDLDSELLPIQGDSSALSLAFMNLCVNAVDAMPESGTLTLHTRNVNHIWVEVVVEDNGMGMPKEVLEKAMDPFFTTKDTGKGTGLGLSMVFSTVKAHRGQMAIESEPSMGTRVILRFPTWAEDTPVQPAGTATHAEGTPHGQLKVLLVDDDELIQNSVQALLEVLGYTAVTTAPSGEVALALLEAGLAPDVIILDMNMPGLGGAATLPRLRELNPTAPVLLATGRVDQMALTLASEHPGVTLLPKPFGLRELQKHLEGLGLG